MTYFLASLFGYLLGSIPFGLIIAFVGGEGDIRAIGSGNIGATNVLRTGNKKLAAATLICDGLKGFFAVFFAYKIWGFEASLVAGLAAFLGHIFPIWLKFKGGKGVATFLGVAFAFYWVSALLFIATWLLTAKLSKYSSLAGMLAASITPISLLFFGLKAEAAVMLVMAAILTLMHHENISRLLKGIESKIGEKSKTP